MCVNECKKCVVGCQIWRIRFWYSQVSWDERLSYTRRTTGKNNNLFFNHARRKIYEQVNEIAFASKWISSVEFILVKWSVCGFMMLTCCKKQEQILYLFLIPNILISDMSTRDENVSQRDNFIYIKFTSKLLLSALEIFSEWKLKWRGSDYDFIRFWIVQEFFRLSSSVIHSLNSKQEILLWPS